MVTLGLSAGERAQLAEFERKGRLDDQDLVVLRRFNLTGDREERLRAHELIQREVRR